MRRDDETYEIMACMCFGWNILSLFYATALDFIDSPLDLYPHIHV